MTDRDDIPKQLGKYRLLNLLGRGGMGEVWVAEHTGPAGFARKVALKILPPGWAGDDDLVRRLTREARVIAGSNIPTLSRCMISTGIPGRGSCIWPWSMSGAWISSACCLLRN